MNKTCAKCDKTVYPVEELKCLEKIWHKTCFKCQVCGMTLSMKNYKGFEKLPYCGAHVPKAKATVVADTPENKVRFMFYVIARQVPGTGITGAADA